MDKVDIKWKLVFPQKGIIELFSSEFTLESLSSIIIYLILFILLSSLFYLVYKSISSNKSIYFLLSLLKEADPDHLAIQRRDLLNSAKKREYEGGLWSEFNETLVESSDGKRLFNTIDARNFFNESTLARGITDSRLISAIPGVLTAIGVLGTFLGLQFGFGSLRLDPVSLTDDPTASIIPLIQGAAVAFSTSVWGITASVIFNLIEKFSEHYLQGHIKTLQDKIDQLFPRVLAEQTLIEIQHHGKESEETLKGLAEQIGNKMQEAMLDFSEKFKESFKGTIDPAITNLIKTTDDLAKKQHGNVSEILGNLIEEFISSVGSIGEEHRKNLESASTSVQNGVEQLGTSIDQFMEQITNQIEVWQNQEAKRNEHVDLKIGKLQEGWNESTRVFLARLKKTLDKLDEKDAQRTSIMDEQIERMSSEWNSSLTTFLNNIENQMNSWQTNADQLSQTIESQLASSNAVVQQSQDLANRAEKSHEMLEALTDDIATAAGLMESATINLSKFGEEIGESADSMRGSILDATKLTLAASEKNQEVVNKFNNAVGQLRQLKDELTHVAEYVYQSVTTSKETFEGMEETQQVFLSGMGEHLRGLQEQVAELMNDYAERVQGQTIERMQIWNEQTRTFSDTLVDSISTMNDIVSEIHDKISKVR